MSGEHSHDRAPIGGVFSPEHPAMLGSVVDRVLEDAVAQVLEPMRAVRRAAIDNPGDPALQQCADWMESRIASHLRQLGASV